MHDQLIWKRSDQRTALHHSVQNGPENVELVWCKNTFIWARAGTHEHNILPRITGACCNGCHQPFKVDRLCGFPVFPVPCTTTAYFQWRCNVACKVLPPAHAGVAHEGKGWKSDATRIANGELMHCKADFQNIACPIALT
jgi:hypothetical protein